MYCQFFNLIEQPFSIVPDPRYLFMSERHQEALAHLLYGVRGQGGFILVTGEVGTGKTTVCKGFLEQLPKNTDVAYVINPKLSVRELFETLCDELKIAHHGFRSNKQFIDTINHYLLEAHARGRHTVLMIDEAQNLSPSVLEQIRLLTNLETHEKKLLQIILIGQPELRQLLQQKSLRQLAQRITARYHLEGLEFDEVVAYVKFRLSIAGGNRPLFDASAMKLIYRLTGGIPRLINLLCDRSLLTAYSQESHSIDRAIVKKAGKEVITPLVQTSESKWQGLLKPVLVGGGIAMALLLLFSYLKSASWSVLDPLNAVQPQANKGVQGAAPLVNHVHSEPVPAMVPLQSGEVSAIEPWVMEEVEAQTSLAQLWGVPLKEGKGKDYCRQFDAQDMACLQTVGNWAAFQEYNLPGILKVITPQQKKGYLLVTSVVDNQLIVLRSGQFTTVDRQVLESAWRGEFQVIWAQPSYRSSVIRPGQATDKSVWIDDALEQIAGNWLPLNRVETNETALLARESSSVLAFLRIPDSERQELRVKEFQRATGLLPDGIAGDLTIIRMMQESDGRGPVLAPTITQRIQKSSPER